MTFATLMSEQFRNYGLNLAAAAVAAVNQLKTVERPPSSEIINFPGSNPASGIVLVPRMDFYLQR